MTYVKTKRLFKNKSCFPLLRTKLFIIIIIKQIL